MSSDYGRADEETIDNLYGQVAELKAERDKLLAAFECQYAQVEGVRDENTRLREALQYIAGDVYTALEQEMESE